MLDFDNIPRCSFVKSNGKRCAMAAPWNWIVDGEEKRLCGTHVNLLKKKGHEVIEA